MKLKEEHLAIPLFGVVSGALMMTQVKQRQMVVMSFFGYLYWRTILYRLFGLETQGGR